VGGVLWLPLRTYTALAMTKPIATSRTNTIPTITIVTVCERFGGAGGAGGVAGGTGGVVLISRLAPFLLLGGQAHRVQARAERANVLPVRVFGIRAEG